MYIVCIYLDIVTTTYTYIYLGKGNIIGMLKKIYQNRNFNFTTKDV